MTTYSIRQLSEEFGVSMRALRFYEQRGLLESSRASTMATASRVYNEEDRTRLAEILNLTKMGFSLAEIARGNISDEQYRQQLGFCLERIAELEAAVCLIRERLGEAI